MRCKYCRATIAGDEICYRIKVRKYDRAYNIKATEEVESGVSCISCQRGIEDNDETMPGEAEISAGRERLKAIGRQIYEEFLRRVDDPKNTAKGDGWRDLSWEELFELSLEEDGEFLFATQQGMGDPIWEAADKLVVDAMRVDKAKDGMRHAHLPDYVYSEGGVFDPKTGEYRPYK